MRVLQKILFGIKSARDFRTAAKLAYLRKDQEALELLKNYKGPPEYIAKAELMSADILYRMRRYQESIKYYRNFLSFHISSVQDLNSQEYLRQYAVFFQEHALRNVGESAPNTVTLERLRGLAAKAQFLDRNEFPLP
jgi:hypothetical protein